MAHVSKLQKSGMALRHTVCPLYRSTGKHRKFQIHRLWVQSPESRSTRLQIEKTSYCSFEGINHTNETAGRVTVTIIYVFVSHKVITNKHKESEKLAMVTKYILPTLYQMYVIIFVEGAICVTAIWMEASWRQAKVEPCCSLPGLGMLLIHAFSIFLFLYFFYSASTKTELWWTHTVSVSQDGWNLMFEFILSDLIPVTLFITQTRTLSNGQNRPSQWLFQLSTENKSTME